ncbi:hypothetical protein BDV97DRAFT_394740 [Delphinella strobiligena]|nr:hypothetical protein BDV97DRAFT_394740 [Delphinella strobiligena]
MSGIGEIVGIIACVAAIVSAYNDGRVVVSKIRDKRRKQRAPPPSQLLDESLAEAARDIETEKSRGVTRLGPSFERGDDVAIVQLRQIRVELEAQLFRQLVQALQDESMTDLRPALEASDLGRDHTVTALISLRQRLMVAAPIERELPRLPPHYGLQSRSLTMPRSSFESRTFPIPIQTSTLATHTFTNSCAPRASPGAYQRTQSETLLGTSSPKRRESSPNSISYLPSFFRHKKSEGRVREASSPYVQQNSPSQASLSTVQRGSGYYSPESIDASTAALSLASSPFDTTPLPNQQMTYEDSAAIWATSKTSSTSSVDVSPPLARTTRSHSQFFSHPSRTSYNLPTPTADNNYLGFCKGAWKLQCGAKDALRKRLEFNNGWSSSEVPYLACCSSRCVFAYRLPLDQLEKVWHSSKGVSFRWALLAKSHVEQKSVSSERYAYQCMFCALMGEKPTVFHGVDTLMTHIAGHRGPNVLPPEVLHRTKCIADRVAVDEEGFDVNLRPLGKDTTQPREDSLFEEDNNPWR